MIFLTSRYFSFFTTSTVTLTREIAIFYRGNRIPTHILDTEVQVQTVTSTLSRTVEITPTPTWQTITITPIVTRPPPFASSSPTVPELNLLLVKQKQEQERKALIDQIQSLKEKKNLFGSFGDFNAEIVETPKELDSFESLQKYLWRIRRMKEKQAPIVVAEPLIAIPTTSVSTIYLSGSIPGLYSTSLITIFVDSEGNPLERRKRQISPSAPQAVVATQLVEIGEDHHETEFLAPS
jgi:hypothetical protein